MANIGIMGGTFDPIHNGHLLLGKQAYQEYDLSEVWFMPSHNPPHKTDHPVTDAADRCAMVKLAIAQYPYFRFSDFEIVREGKTYTAQTLSLLAQDYPEHRFYFIVGADSLYELETWHHPDEVLSRTTLLVAGREYRQAPRTMEEQIAYLSEKYRADIRRLHCEEVDISSQELRDMESRGRSIFKYVPKCVEEYIITHGLYTDSPWRKEKQEYHNDRDK